MRFLKKAVLAAVILAVFSGAAAFSQAKYAADGRYPATKIKIGVETFDPSDGGYMSVQSYLQSLAKTLFNVEFIFSEKIDSAEQELQFIENCAAAGAKGILAYYNVSKGQAVAKAAELKMFYWGTAEEKDIYDQYKTNPYYLGSVVLGNGDHDGMYGVTKALLAKGKTKFVYANGGADFGITMFVNRKQGFLDAVNEAKAKGAKISVVEVPGFPNESWFAAQGAALAGDIDAVVSSFGPEIWIQPITAAGKAKTVTVGAFGSIAPSTVDLFKGMFASGLFSAIAAEPSERFGIAVAMIVNAADGNGAALRKNGEATRDAEALWVITNAQDLSKVMDFELGNGRAQYSKDLMKLVKKINPAAGNAAILELIKGFSLEAIKARK